MAKTPEQIVDAAKAWWSTDIIDIHPGQIICGKVTWPIRS